MPAQPTSDRTIPILLAILGLAGALQPAAAAPVADPVGDFLPTFTGTPVAALDIVSADLRFDPDEARFTFRADLAGAVGEGNLRYVLGIDRGEGPLTQPFGPIGLPDIGFDAVLVLAPNGRGTLGLIGGATQEVQGKASGNTVGLSFDAGLLPASARAPENFTWAMWTIDLGVSGLARNADFAPVANLPAVPEPQTWALLALGLAGVAVQSRRKTKK